MLRLAFTGLILLAAQAAGAQEQDATDTPQEKLKKMRAVEGRMPTSVATSFKRRTVDSREAPWRAIGRVNIGGRAHCSGSLIGERVVLTAAHCLFSKHAQQMVVPTIVHFVAGYARGEYLAHSRVKRYFVPDGFDGTKGAHADNLPHDWALLELEEPIGTDGGFLPLHDGMRPGSKPTGPILSTTRVVTAGYPGDRAHILSLEENCRIRGIRAKSHVMLTDCLAIRGDSGGPVLQKLNDRYVLIGLQTASTNLGGKQGSMAISALAFRDTLTDFTSP